MQQCLARFHVSRYRADITNSSLSQVATKKEKHYCLWVIQLHFGQSLTAVMLAGVFFEALRPRSIAQSCLTPTNHPCSKLKLIHIDCLILFIILM